MSAAPMSKGYAGLLAWHTVRNPHRHGDRRGLHSGLSSSQDLRACCPRRHVDTRICGGGKPA